MSSQVPNKKSGSSLKKPLEINKAGSVKKEKSANQGDGKYEYAKHRKIHSALLDSHLVVLYLLIYLTAVCFLLGQLMQVEERGKGSVPWAVYKVYIQALGGWSVFLFILALFVLNVGSTAFSNWWLSYWIKQGSGVRDHEQSGAKERRKGFNSVRPE